MNRKIIESARWKLTLYLLISLVFTGVSGALLTGTPDEESWKAWLGMAFFGACSAIMLFQLVRPQRLVLDADGFQVDGGLRPGRKVAWREVESFFRWKLPRGGTMVGYRYHDAGRPRAAIGGFDRGFGVDGVLPRTLTLGADALIAEMETWRRRGAGAVAPPTLVE